MGIDVNAARFLLYAGTLGVSFSSTAMVGRQRLDLFKHELGQMLRAFGHQVDAAGLDQLFSQNTGYADPLLRLLGADVVHSFDVSGYEGATFIHDMNAPIPSRFKEQYSVVLDVGSLEHVFNYPVAIKNCMEMVRVGGHCLTVSPANNFMGHGFYQFSPELYFSVFTRENGFRLAAVIAYEDSPGAEWYAVRSPAELRQRVTLMNSVPVYLVVVAQKLESTGIFARAPQQSDYLSMWQQTEACRPSPANRWSSCRDRLSAENSKRLLQEKLRGRAAPWCLYLMRRAMRRCRRGFDPRFFRRMSPTPRDPSSSDR